ncbi:hypothetical protein A4G18_02985 [Pasteurellaceae bacterium Pebbles2]|nr:hypothetical protein [Pasteurellaceae bacterium Pebbles2]
MNKFKFVIIAVLAVFLTACTAQAEAKKSAKITHHISQSQNQKVKANTYKVNGKLYSTKPNGAASHYEKQGKASFYHRKFNGRRTANGEIYNGTKFTAAHKTLPFGTHLLVTNLRNNRKVVVRVNDRGPFVRGRIIDLSRVAAAEIGMISSGVGNVKVETLHLVRN